MPGLCVIFCNTRQPGNAFFLLHCLSPRWVLPLAPGEDEGNTAPLSVCSLVGHQDCIRLAFICSASSHLAPLAGQLTFLLPWNLSYLFKEAFLKRYETQKNISKQTSETTPDSGISFSTQAILVPCCPWWSSTAKSSFHNQPNKSKNLKSSS